MHIKKLAHLSLLLSLGVVLYILEAIFFPPLPIPGAKLGLGNLVTLYLLVFFGFKDTLLNIILRTSVGALLTGTIFALPFFFSLTGALVSFIVMFVSMKISGGKLSLVGISVLGSVAHNLAQLVLAMIVLSHLGIITQMPWLILIAVLTGIFNGVVANYTVKRMKPLLEPA